MGVAATPVDFDSPTCLLTRRQLTLIGVTSYGALGTCPLEIQQFFSSSCTLELHKVRQQLYVVISPDIFTVCNSSDTVIIDVHVRGG